jgi:hypothetical protein
MQAGFPFPDGSARDPGHTRPGLERSLAGQASVEREGPMPGIIWGIIVVLFILWLLGFTIGHLGGIIHLVLVIAVILLIFNLVTGRGARV